MNNQYNNLINNINMNMNINMNYQNQNYFNINNLNQMNKFIQNTNNIIPKIMNTLYGINYEDIYPYINENKINISFKNKDNVIKNVSIPASLRNIELYYTADKINNPELFEYTDVNSIKLYVNNQLIPNNDESINKNELNNAQILINETIEDLSYYDSIMQNGQNEKKINICFDNINQNNKNTIIIPNNIKVKDLLLCFFAKNKIPKSNRKYFSFLCSGKNLDLNNENLLNDERIRDGCKIQVSTHDIKNDMEYSKKEFPGKKLNVSLRDKNDVLIGDIYASSLQRIKIFYKKLKNYLSQKKNIIFTGKAVILYSEIILNKLDERTFSSIGILNDFSIKLIE
jgi:hypothetical protein